MTLKDSESIPATVRYELRYPALFGNRCAFAFPCDAQGHVALAQLSERARKNLLYAQATVGTELGWPQISVRG